jgi:hypothetical protein
LRKNLRREVLFGAFSRGRYSTDASIDQIKPLGVVVPRNAVRRECLRIALLDMSGIIKESGTSAIPG